MSYPKGAVGDIDVSPGDDDGVFDGLEGGVHTQECVVSFVSDLDMDGAAFRVLS